MQHKSEWTVVETGGVDVLCIAKHVIFFFKSKDS